MPREHAGEAFEIPTLTMFCVAMRRALYEEIGPLDERFETGLLEDDDYSRRVREAGYRLLCADDAFVHHFGETSFGKLVASGEYARILEANRARFEEKWGDPWQPLRAPPERPVPNADRDGCSAAVDDSVPAGATVLVVSRGDEELLRIGWPPGVALPARRRRRVRGPPSGRQPRRRSPCSSGNARRVPSTSSSRPRDSGGWSTTRGCGDTWRPATAVSFADPEICVIFDLAEDAR